MVDCCSAPGLMPLEQAKETLLNTVTGELPSEEIAIEQADKRVLSTTIRSPINVPGHNNSAMDGYAIKFHANEKEYAESQTKYTLVGTAMAGQPYTGPLASGEAIRIMTGAVVPSSADAVEMQENIQVQNNVISLTQSVKRGSHIRLAGEDIKKDEPVFEQGHIISAIDIGLLASLGLLKVPVFSQLNVAVFSTGDELKQPGEALEDGDIYESNRYVLIALLNRIGVNVIDLGVIEDDLDAITTAFKQADSQADAVISSGGVSVGDADFTKEVLTSLGNINFWKVAIKPGKPFAFGKLPHSLFFGLPGNPVSAVVTFHQLVVPTLYKMMSVNSADVASPLFLQAKTTGKIKKRPGRTDFQRGIAAINGSGQLIVTPIQNQGSGVLSSIAKANCYIVLEQQQSGCNEGEQVSVLLFDNLLS